MSDRDGWGDEMLQFRRLRTPMPLDDRTADRLITGAIDADDVPQGYARVARLVASAAESGECEGEEAAMALFAAARGALEPEPFDSSGRRRMLPQVLTAKAVAAAITATLALTGGVAAATGHLPDDAQRVVHEKLGTIGVSVPDPDGSEDAPGSGKGKTISSIAHDPATTGVDKGRAVCTEASDGTCQAGQHGKPEQPGRPGESGRPDDPGQPGDPGRSGEAGRPDDPGKPGDPGKGNGSTTTTSSTAPSTQKPHPGNAGPSGPPEHVPPASRLR